MIFCAWCGKEDKTFLDHVCPDGAQFLDRAAKGIAGQVPKCARQWYKWMHRVDISVEYPDTDYSILALTLEDMQFLKGLKIDW
jgi:hypothetical protein